MPRRAKLVQQRKAQPNMTEGLFLFTVSGNNLGYSDQETDNEESCEKNSLLKQELIEAIKVENASDFEDQYPISGSLDTNTKR